MLARSDDEIATAFCAGVLIGLAIGVGLAIGLWTIAR